MTRATECCGHALSCLVLDVTQYHPGTVIYISLCRCRTNAAGGTGDDRDFTFQPTAHFHSSFMLFEAALSQATR
ncbi:MAG: Uncharacterised protein [Halieaceae bacterium]|nr:MAG: Uncharacterised protein [Halieaceae bacterium]